VADDDDRSVRRDLDDSLLHLNRKMQQTRRDVFELEMTVYALVDELIQEKAVDEPALNERWMEVRKRELETAKSQVRVRINETRNKYALTVLPDVDCEARMHLCKGRCCTLRFPLSNQDLDERVVEWDHRQPYLIRQERREGTPTPAGDNWCVHNDRATGGCSVYHHRPAVCRTYTCENDKRIWKDFHARIPAEKWPPDPDEYI